MRREELVHLNAFVVVAEAKSFTRAAAKPGTSQSALSYTLRRLEERLGVRLLVRTTRRIAPTEAGEKLLGTLRPALDEIGSRLAELTEFREKPAGAIRITAGKHFRPQMRSAVIRAYGYLTNCQLHFALQIATYCVDKEATHDSRVEIRILASESSVRPAALNGRCVM
jgi:DNA-binding transcriptional LysR family regulator